jgi:hypothetical protein
MLAGGDSIDDVDVLRAGAARELFDDIRAPSTIGTWLRGFIWATVRMFDEVSRQVLARAWTAGLGPDLDPDLTVDFDSTICRVFGTAKQGARFGYTKVRGYHPLLATLADTGEVLHARMRGRNAGAARGAGTFVRETIRRIRDAGARGALTVRADSAFYSRAVVAAWRKHGASFSVTVDKNSAIRRAIGAIDDDAWVPIPYWFDAGADVAETTYTAFKGTKDKVELRLIVRRVRPTPGSQLALDVDYHAILTDRHGELLEISADHRRHAVIELAIRDLKAGGLAHVPSGIFTANAAWLGLAVLAHKLGRWTLAAAGDGWSKATTETLGPSWSVFERLARQGSQPHDPTRPIVHPRVDVEDSPRFSPRPRRTHPAAPSGNQIEKKTTWRTSPDARILRPSARVAATLRSG